MVLKNESGSWICPACGKKVPSGYVYCIFCGVKRSDRGWACQRCGKQQPSDDYLYCIFCGSKREVLIKPKPVVKEEVPQIPPVPQPPPPSPVKVPQVDVSRGIEYVADKVKVGIKVDNKSDFAILDASVKLNAPKALQFTDPKLPYVDLGNLKSGEFQSAIFWLRPTRCVSGLITGTVHYADPSGKIHTSEIRPLEVQTICPFLTDENVDVDGVLALLRGGELESRKVSFEFLGEPSAVFIIAENRVRSLINVERDESTVNGVYIGHCCYVGRTKYGEHWFATAIDVSGSEHRGALTLTVSSNEPAILTGYFLEIKQDVERHVKIVEEKVMRVLNTCSWCGAELAIERVDEQGKVQCDFCRRLVILPKWMRS